MKKHYHWLDLLRFLAAFEVVLSHYRGVFFAEYSLLPAEQQNLFTSLFYSATRLSNESVLLFFVLSGFLVGGNSLQRILSNTVDVKSYLIDRLVRIILPLLASVVLVILIDLVTGQPIPFVSILGSLFSLQGIFTDNYTNSPLWSLSYEVWFYVLMACIMAVCRIKKLSVLLFSFLMLVVVGFVFTKLNPIHLVVWCIGAFAFLLPKSKSSVSKLKLLFYSGLFLVSFALLQITSGSRSVAFGSFLFLNRNLCLVFAALTSGLFIHNISQFVPKNKLALKIDSVGSRLSKFSYSLYLTHYPVIYLFCHYGFPEHNPFSLKSISFYVFAVLLCLLLAYLVYLLSEKHTDFVKRLLKEKVFTSKT